MQIGVFVLGFRSPRVRPIPRTTTPRHTPLRIVERAEALTPLHHVYSPIGTHSAPQNLKRFDIAPEQPIRAQNMSYGNFGNLVQMRIERTGE